MTPEHGQQILALLKSALEREPQERAAFLDEACGRHESLRNKVEALIAAHEQAGSFLERPAFELMAESLNDNQAELVVGQTLGHYRVLEQLGAGGMGEVYLAQDSRLGRKVALKMLPDYFTRDDERVRRFQQEARAASALNHPNILTIHEIGQIDSRHFIVTEFIEGETLRQRMNRTPIKLGEALDVAIQVASALAAAHQAGIAHRDIKPENIMLRPDGVVKVLDFGLAKLTEHKGNDLEAATLVNTKQGIVMGTAHYMSPEQARGQKIDARSDLFSLGAVLYEMVAGRLPFEGETMTDVLASILRVEPAALNQSAPGTPAELQRIVDQALRKDKDERYQKAKELLSDLKDLKQRLEFEIALERSVQPQPRSQSAPVTQSSGHGAAATSIESTTPPTSSVEYVVSQIKHHRRGVAALVVLILLLVAGSAYYFYFARSSETPALVVLILLLVAGSAYYFYFARSSKTPIDSIAVLPLNNTSGDPNAEYLSDGISEALINSLTELQQLRVVARGIAFRYKGKEVDPQAVGRELNVRAVLMGRVRQVGDALSIQVDLVDVTTGAQLWGGEYERKVSDVLSVKQTIAREIIEKLRLRLSGDEQQRLVRRDTTNAEAYPFYLRGRYYWNKRTAEGFKKALEQFQQAVDKDPTYALAYTGLADCYMLMEEYARTPSRETLPKPRAAALRALEIDNSLGEAHTSLGLINMNSWQFGEAEKEFKRGIELNPNYPTAHHWFGTYLLAMGRLDEAMVEMKRAQQLDPLSPVISAFVVIVYFLKGDLNSAVEGCKRIIELDPNYPRAHNYLGWAYLKQGRQQEAIAELQKAVEVSQRHEEGLSYLAYGYATLGKRAEALAVLKELEEMYARQESRAMFIAAVYDSLGDKDQAFAWLEKDFQARTGILYLTTPFPIFESLRGDARYTDLLRRMGLRP